MILVDFNLFLIFSLSFSHQLTITSRVFLGRNVPQLFITSPNSLQQPPCGLREVAVKRRLLQGGTEEHHSFFIM